MGMCNINWAVGTIEDINFTNGVVVDSNLSGVDFENCEITASTMFNGIPLLEAFAVVLS